MGREAVLVQQSGQSAQDNSEQHQISVKGRQLFPLLAMNKNELIKGIVV